MKCDICGKKAVYRLYHRDGSESVICDKCEKPSTAHNISKLGLEFKNENSFKVRFHD
jgi:ribosome-binding protein aMBF1 (putative translation factor)